MLNRHYDIMMLFIYLILVIFEYIYADQDFCEASSLVCKPTEISRNTDKVIRRWLEKVRASPLCFAGPGSQTLHNQEDNTFEVVSLKEGRKHGVAVKFLDDANKFMAGVTFYQVDIIVHWLLKFFRYLCRYVLYH